MKQRINIQEHGREAMSALVPLGKHLAKSPLKRSLLELVYFRVSQINGCAFCLDMHAKELRAMGDTEERLNVMAAWREAPFYSDRERAALAYAESLTELPGGGRLVPDEIFNELKKHFSETEIIDLTVAIFAINGYNRINIAFGAPVGTYEVGQFAN
ncbi:carboxymuconolactone decarboxylase family protein [Sinomicrobium weinanense]|uniref:Carboxymuconolactone decarboxylase family protein n=1 Tax=Sinomicrobium weinanense TaxID=2842200 RepID=A0A926JTE9_9FLAO|nr:carboxymuconolactone decarboxylase family protein [Sinomicrobium weinanense]MBC9797041.1 carboxymuconolactone decarboxylase family protein [Sinomicrobium weinanense]MBU3122036.1 carboxymuconolactone decarboxylase family protein [Sinomicrobium weinanense]